MIGFILAKSFFVSDLHGHYDRYEKLFKAISEEHPQAVFLGGDILPAGIAVMSGVDISHRDFINEFLIKKFMSLKKALAKDYPRIFLILGNDDSRFEEAAVLEAAATGVWEYVHQRRVLFNPYVVYGYTYVAPTPFAMKDWEKYDVSRMVDPGCVSPEEGYRTVPVSNYEKKYMTIAHDLENLTEGEHMGNAIFLFHSPPYNSKLDRANLDGKTIDYVPLDVHVGSIAIKRFIEARQPMITLHGHIHESARLTGSWRDKIGDTYAFSAAHDGPELALVRFDPNDPEHATRELL